MRLFRRIGDVVAANLNDLVDRFEDPEVMLKQAIREMEAMIESATGAAARAIAGERLLAKDLADHERKALRWKARATEAVVGADEDLARQCIARAHEHEALALVLAEQRSSAAQTSQALRGRVNAMKAKQAEARRMLTSLSARRQVAEASRALRGAVFESSRGPNGFARFEQMQRRIEQAEAEAVALGELCAYAVAVPEVETTSREQDRYVEAELSAIKERLRSSQEPLG